MSQINMKILSFWLMQLMYKISMTITAFLIAIQRKSLDTKCFVIDIKIPNLCQLRLKKINISNST